MSNEWRDWQKLYEAEHINTVEAIRQLAEANAALALPYADALARAEAALAEAKKGLEKMRDYADQHVSNYSHVCGCYWPQELREQAKDALASIEALKVQP